MQIDVDPGLPSGFMFERFEVMVRGRVVSPASIVEVRLERSGQLSSVASYGQPERATIVSMPDGEQWRQREFQFNLPFVANADRGQKTFQIVARTIDNLECAETFVVELDHSAPAPVVLISGPSRGMPIAGRFRPHALLYIERGTIDNYGQLSVYGWAVAMSPILAVHVYAGEKRVGHAPLGGEREDVAAAYASYPNSRFGGFALTVQLDDADRDASTIRAQIVCSNGFGHEESIPVERISRRPVAQPQPTLIPPAKDADSQAISSRGDDLVGAAKTAVAADAITPAKQSAQINLFCDEAVLTDTGRLTVNGWTVCAAGIAQVRLRLDDQEVGLATFGHERPDVGANFRHIAMARFSGFKFDHGIGDHFEGEHTLQVVVCNMLGEEEVTQSSVTVTIAAPVASITTAAPETAVEPTPEQAAEFKFELDAPATSNGAAVEPVTGRLTIDGWLLCRSGVEKFEVFLNDQRLGDMHYGLARQDVGTAFPDWPNSLRSGYAFHCPPRSLRNGEHTIHLKVRATSGAEIEKSFTITVQKSEEGQDQAGLRRRVPRIETDMMIAFLDDLNYRPSFTFVLRQDRPVSLAQLRTTLNAFRLQCYEDWTMLVLAADTDVATGMQAAIDDTLPHLADRFTIITPQDPRWTEPLADEVQGRSRLVGLLLPGDEIGADTLLELAVAAGRTPAAGLIYGDEVRISPVSRETEPFFKPDYSPDLIYATNYIGRPWVATAAVMAASGATPASLCEAGEYDLVLRCLELTGCAHHVPKLLCQRAPLALDDAAQEKAALQGAMDRLGIAATVRETPIPGTWRVKRALHTSGKVSIIIPTCAAHGYIETCIRTLREKTAYRNYEIVVIDNIPETEPTWKAWVLEHADKIVNIPGTFNWSIFNNRAAEASEGDYFLFLND
ncbi:MAG TPA: glycosyltransferase, partial [Rhodopila sp.]|nr:glycosyltransferase [Rhodopila sp.]